MIDIWWSNLLKKVKLAAALHLNLSFLYSWGGLNRVRKRKVNISALLGHEKVRVSRGLKWVTLTARFCVVTLKKLTFLWKDFRWKQLANIAYYCRRSFETIPCNSETILPPCTSALSQFFHPFAFNTISPPGIFLPQATLKGPKRSFVVVLGVVETWENMIQFEQKLCKKNQKIF